MFLLSTKIKIQRTKNIYLWLRFYVTQQNNWRNYPLIVQCDKLRAFVILNLMPYIKLKRMQLKSMKTTKSRPKSCVSQCTILLSTLNAELTKNSRRQAEQSHQLKHVDRVITKSQTSAFLFTQIIYKATGARRVTKYFCCPLATIRKHLESNLPIVSNSVIY